MKRFLSFLLCWLVVVVIIGWMVVVFLLASLFEIPHLFRRRNKELVCRACVGTGADPNTNTGACVYCDGRGFV
jgi:hypothetical protein